MTNAWKVDAYGPKQRVQSDSSASMNNAEAIRASLTVTDFRNYVRANDNFRAWAGLLSIHAVLFIATLKTYIRS